MTQVTQLSRAKNKMVKQDKVINPSTYRIVSLVFPQLQKPP